MHRSSLTQPSRFSLLARASRLVLMFAALALAGLLSLGGCAVEPTPEDGVAAEGDLAESDLGEDVETSDNAIKEGCFDVTVRKIATQRTAESVCPSTCENTLIDTGKGYSVRYKWNRHWVAKGFNLACGCCPSADVF